MEAFYEGGLKTRCVHPSGAEILADSAPGECAPTDVLAFSLGACVLTMIGFLAEKIHVDVSGSKVSITKEMSKDPPRRIAKITVVFTCPRTFSQEIQTQLEKTGLECPIHYSLHPDLVQDIRFIWGKQ